MEEQSALLKTISHQLENLNRDIPELQVKVSNAETSISSLSDVQSSFINRMAAKPDPFVVTNAIQVRIDDNVRMLAELHARWEREDEMARNMKVCTITTTSDVVSNASKPPSFNGRVIGVEKIPTPCAKLPKTTESFSNKSVESFRSMGDNSSTTFNDFDFDGCNISEVILFLQKLARSPNASSMNVAFTKHIMNALMLGLPPLENCYFDVPLANVAKKKPLGRINDFLIMINNNFVSVDFLVLDIECNASCPIILGRLFHRTVGAIIDMKEDTIKYQFPLKKGMEHFPRKRKKLPFDSILRANYELDASSFENT
jgi:hypothetical protein